MSYLTTWVRRRDAEGNQFDRPEGDPLREGESLVKGYPVHVAPYARDGKPHVDLELLKVDELEAEIDRHNAVAPEDAEIVPASRKKADLVAALTAAGVETTSDDTSDTGEQTNQPDAGVPAQESE